jgi:L-fucose isomerase-like protein
MVRIGFVPSHRSPFNKEWAISMRDRVIKSIEGNIEEIELIYPDKKLTDGGLVTFKEDADKVIKLFKEKDIQGLIIGMMTFGEEIPNLLIAEAFDSLPIQVFATKEGPFTEDGNRKSDSFCGTISTASGLVRRNIKFDFSGIYFPEEKEFISDIKRFSKAVIARAGFTGMKIGALGPRPAPFETCAINELDLIEKFRIKVVPFTLLKLKADIENTKEEDIKEIENEIKKSYDCKLADDRIISKIARLEYVLNKYAGKENLSGFAIQCWTAMQEEIGVSPCLSMGRLTDSGIMCACEVDIHGAITMVIQHLLTLMKDVPHFIDWTIQNQENENTFLAWHCGNAPISLKCKTCRPQINTHSVLGWQIGYDKSYGTAEFQLKEGLVTLNRLVETGGKFKMLSTVGEAVPDNRTLRGSWKWIEVKDLKKLYRTIIEEGFVHHASMIFGDIRREMNTFCKFTGIDVIEV